MPKPIAAKMAKITAGGWVSAYANVAPRNGPLHGVASTVPEDELTWLLQHVGLVIDKINKVNALTFREPVKAALALMEPVLRMFGDVLEKYVTDDVQRVAARQNLQERLARIMVPIG